MGRWHVAVDSLSTKRLPRDQRDRAEEWHAEINEYADRPLSMVLVAVRVRRDARAIAHEVPTAVLESGHANAASARAPAVAAIFQGVADDPPSPGAASTSSAWHRSHHRSDNGLVGNSNSGNAGDKRSRNRRRGVWLDPRDRLGRTPLMALRP